MKEKSYLPGTHPDLPPPTSEVGVIGWARKNLFATPADTIFTLLALYVLYSIVPGFMQWAFIDAVYVAENREACWKMMQTGKEVETMVIVLSTYLVLSLIISGSMNLLNYRLKIKGR